MNAKILVADDAEDNRAIMKAALTKAGFTVCEAQDGLEAIETALRELPALILLDLSMPRLSGWETVQRMKTDPKIGHIPVFAFTAHALAGDDQKARQAGCDGYIAKPCLPKEAVAKIESFLRITHEN